MSIESDSQGELYEYFLAEAPELLQIIEETLLSLIEEKSVEKVHTLMRSAHTLKGSAASVEEETIKTIAHHLEDVFEALYPEELTIDSELGALLLEGYDCLREPLSATISNLTYDENTVLEQTAAVFAQLQDKLGDFFGREAALPTSEELGFDVVGSIFAESVVQDLELLEEIIVSQDLEEIEEVLRSQAEFFADLGASYDLPGLIEISETTLTAIEYNPQEILEIAVAALTNFHQARADILNGDREMGGQVSAELQNLVGEEQSTVESSSAINLAKDEVFDESFFVEPIEDGSEMTMAFSAEWANNLQIVDVTVESESQPVESEPEVLTTETIEENDEIIVTEAEVTSIQLNANYQAAAKSPVEEILQSITVLNVPLITPEKDDDLGAKNSNKAFNASIPSIKVAIEQLDQLNHTIGELLIKENQQNLQQEQLQLLLKETFLNFRSCQEELSSLGDWSEQQKRDYKRQQKKLRYRKIAVKNSVSDAFFPLSTTQTKGFSNLVKPKLPNSSTNFDALEMDVYSDLDLKLQAVGEKMTQLGNKIETIERIVQQSSLDVSKRKQILDRAQEGLLQARMLPLSTVLNRFPRHVQQMVSSYGKPAKLKTIGGEVSIDKAIAEKLYEPLLHLIRNSYDHGLEAPKLRLAQGKPEVGKITIRAYNRGNRTIIEIQDDGQGIDLGKIITKAIEKNFIEPSQLETITDSDITEFLFQPGFSTASEVTDLSGRGVGLNVVKSQIKALNGEIMIRSTEGIGTTFTLQLPLTLSTARLLLCEAQGIIYGILSTEIERVITSSPEHIHHQPSLIGESKESFWRYQQGDQTELIPICPLENLVNYSFPVIPRKSSLLKTLTAKKEKTLNKSLILVQAEGKRLCLEVERVLTEQELVIKSFNNLVILPNYIQGYSVLGDGNLSLVINPVELVGQTYNKSNSNSLQNMTSSSQLYQSSLAEMTIAENIKAISYRQPTILLVEDSIVQRKSLVMILEKNDFEIIQAGNGKEAIAILEENSTIDLIISDIEMPVMNGFELLSYCQNNSRFSSIPIVITTTRSGQKHRQLAFSLGAKQYMTKPSSEQELLGVVNKYISI